MNQAELALLPDGYEEPPHAGCLTGETCLWCEGPEWVDLLEVWPDPDTGAIRDFQIATCCEGSHEGFVQDLSDCSRKSVAAWFAARGFPIRQVYSDCHHLRLDMGLEVRPITFKQATAFVAEHHRHNKPPRGWKFGAGAFNDTELVAVVMVGRPVARAIGADTVEVNRLCVNPGADPALTWNACSQLYGWAAREAKARGFARIITYTLESEGGGTLVAAGWTKEARTKGGSWNTPSRPREDQAPTVRKWRWSRSLAA